MTRRHFALRAWVFAASLAAAHLGAAQSVDRPARTSAPSSSSTRTPAYDAESLLDSVRVEERAGLAAALGVSALDALPLYDLHLSIDAGLRGFGLRERVVVTNGETRPWVDVVMRIFVNAPVSARRAPPVRLLEGRCLDGVRCTFEQPSPSVVRIRPEAPLAPGSSLRFELDLQGTMASIDDERLTMLGQGLESLAALEGGVTSGDYGLLARGAGIGSLASFYPVLARRSRGRWVTDDGGTMGDLSTDAPHHVRARIVVPEEFVVVSSGVEVAVADVADPDDRPPRKEVTVHAAAVREFAVLVSPDFESRACTVDGVRIRSLFLSRDASAGRHVGEVACDAFGVFSRRFGAYPFTELDVVEAPLVGGAGGVEFSGLVTVALMFYRGALEGGGGSLGLFGMLGALRGAPDISADAGIDAVDRLVASMREFVTAHEVAHQWWHGLVGSDSRAHPWLDEALAQHSAVLYVEDRHGPARAREEAERQVAMNYRLMRIQGLPDDVVDRPASAFRSPLAYAGLVYGKAPFFYRAVRERVGDEAFFRALRAYVQAYRFREAPSVAVIDALARESGGLDAEVRALARRWIYERHGDEDLGPNDPSSVLRTMLPPEFGAVLSDPSLGSLLQGMMGSLLGGSIGDAPDRFDAALRGFLGEGGEIDEPTLRRGLDEITRRHLGDPSSELRSSGRAASPRRLCNPTDRDCNRAPTAPPTTGLPRPAAPRRIP